MTMTRYGAAALLLLGGIGAASPAAAVTTVLTFAGNICGVGGNEACGNGSQIGQNYGDSAIQDVSYRSFVAATNATFEPYLKYWNTGYGNLTDVVWAGSDPTSYGAEIVITPAAGYEVSLTSFLGACYQDRGSCQRFPYTVGAVGGPASAGAVVPPSGGSQLVSVNSAYSASGIVLRWGPDAYDGGLDNITFDVRQVSAVPGAVPEPATWAAMLLGFGMLGGALRRRATPSTRVRFA